MPHNQKRLTGSDKSDPVIFCLLFVKKLTNYVEFSMFSNYNSSKMVVTWNKFHTTKNILGDDSNEEIQIYREGI